MAVLPAPGPYRPAAGQDSLRRRPKKFPDIDLNTRADSEFGGEDLTADFFGNVGFAAIGAHFGGDGFEDERRGIALQGDGGAAGASLATFADYALHIFFVHRGRRPSLPKGIVQRPLPGALDALQS